MICIIAAYDKNRVIGRDGALPWSLKKDMERFKNITFGHTVVMGRKTYDSIGHPLKNRRNIVFSRDGLFSAEGCESCGSVDDILTLAENEPVFIVGGESIYKAMLPMIDTVYVTKIDAAFDADRYFPNLDEDPAFAMDWQAEEACEENGYSYRFVRYKRVNSNGEDKDAAPEDSEER